MPAEAHLAPVTLIAPPAPLTAARRLQLRAPIQRDGLRAALAAMEEWFHAPRDPRSASEIAELIYRLGVSAAIDSLQPETAAAAGIDLDDDAAL